LFFIPRFQEP